MFSSIVAPAFQRLAAAHIQHRNDEERKRSGDKDQIAHDEAPEARPELFPKDATLSGAMDSAACIRKRRAGITMMSGTAPTVGKQ